MKDSPAVTSPTLLIGAIILMAVGVGLLAVSGIDRSGEKGSRSTRAYDSELESHKKIDPALIRYEQTREFPCRVAEARAVATGPDDRIYVAGDRGVSVFNPDGSLEKRIELDESPRSLAIAPPDHAAPGRIYLGMNGRVEVLDENGESPAAWESLGEKAVLTAIAVADEDVFVADAGNQVVLRYDTSGSLVGRIGALDEERGRIGFVIPSPFFDLAVGPDKLLYVVNPGALRIEAFSFDGNLQRFWGKAGTAIEGFVGCCNPANLAVLPDGRFVTAEKGILRVKIYTADGEFECVVAGPEQLESPAGSSPGSSWYNQFQAVDVATDSHGRVLILDPAAGKVQIYESKQLVEGEDS